MSNIDYLSDRMCPIYEDVISSVLCQEANYALLGMFKIATVPELNNVRVEDVRGICSNCEYNPK